MQTLRDPVVQQITEELEKLRGLPRDQARTMLQAYYTAPEFLRVEKEELFRKEWICLGYEGEIPHAGDYFTTDLVDEPLLVVRGQDECVRVLSNVCRHRGNVVARGSGNASRFTCGYHAWTYGTDGNLLAAPLMEGFDKTGCRLPRFSVEIWKGFIFVNLDGNASPLAMTLREVEPLIDPYRSGIQNFLYGGEEAWATNWKCLVENFMEGYHLSFTHQKTLHPYSPSALCEKLPNGGSYTGYRSGLQLSCPDLAPYQPDLNAVEKRSIVLYCVYPSFVVAFGPGSASTLFMCVRPLTVDSVGIRWGSIGLPEPDAAIIKEKLELTKAFCAEDRAALEGLHRGLKSRYYQPGPLAGNNLEGTIWDILQYMAGRLSAHVRHPVDERGNKS